MNQTSRSQRCERAIFFIFFVTSLFIFCCSAWQLLHQALIQIIPFDTDEADHANGAIELFRAFQSGHLGSIYTAITRQAFYPPVHSFFVAVSYWILDVNVASSRAPSALFFIALGGALCLLAYRTSRRLGFSEAEAIIAAAASLLFITGSEITLENAALCMLELCGIFFTTLVLISVPETTKRGYVSLFPLALLTFLVMLTKYSFGIMVLPGVICGLILLEKKPFLTRESILSCLPFLLLYTALAALWFLISDPNSIIQFFISHPQYAPLFSSENIFFDIHSWIFEYGSYPSLSVVISLMAIIGTFNGWQRPSVRVAVGIVASSFAILLLSTTNESRHFMPAAPCLWFLASLGVSWCTQVLVIKSKTLGLLFATLFIALFTFAAYHMINRIPEIVTHEMEGKPSYGELQDFIMESLNCSTPALVIGPTDQFGIEALRWRVAATCNMPYTAVHLDTYPFNDAKNITALKRERDLDKPYTDSLFPREPIEAVLNQSYYKAIIMIRTIGDRGSNAALIKELKDKIFGAELTISKKGDKEITVILL